MKSNDRGRRDLLLIFLLVPFGMVCMFLAGQIAIQLDTCLAIASRPAFAPESQR